MSTAPCASSGSAPVELARPENVAAAQRALAGVAEGALEVHCELAAVVEVAQADRVPELVRADALVVVRAGRSLVGPLHVGAEAGVALDVGVSDPPHPGAGDRGRPARALRQVGLVDGVDAVGDTGLLGGRAVVSGGELRGVLQARAVGHGLVPLLMG